MGGGTMNGMSGLERIASPLGAALLAAVVIAAAAARGAESQLPPRPQPIASPVAELAPAPTPAPEPTSAPGPARLTGTAGANLNAALAAAGVSEAVAQDYLRALATRISLADGISTADRFDLVVDRPPSGRASPERLLYAGLDRLGAPDVQLMRWAEAGKTGWMDASGTDSAAQAMRLPVAASVSSSFGMRSHPILGSHRFHKGVDLRAAFGTPIRASADGRVAAAGWNGGYGREVRLDHGQGLQTLYAHMSRLAASPGQRVHAGEIIGYVGSSGLSTGPHLHYEVLKDGRPVNPLAARTVGATGLDRDQRRAFNASLRTLLSFKPGQG
jgi:murein DD-endopeptidase MepM/ murein hydrolase activator NlpD